MKIKFEGALDYVMKMVIVPVSPLSIVEKHNSSYAKSTMSFSNQKVYGLIENVCGFHFGEEIRAIINKKKNYTTDHKENKYLPIIDEVIDIKNINTPKYTSFIDAYSYLLRYTDERHIKGSKTFDSSVDMTELANDPSYFASNHHGKFAKYYTGLMKREWMNLEGNIEIVFNTNFEFKEFLLEKIKTNNSAYLGNSESIVNLELYEL